MKRFTLKKFLTDIATDNAGDADVVSVLGVLATLVMLGLTIFIAITTGTFDVLNFGTAVGLLLAGLGGGYWAKNGSTPQVLSQSDEQSVD